VVDKAYLKDHLIATHLIERIREQVLGEAIVWSIQESMKMDQGRVGQEEQQALNAPSNEPSSASSVQEADPLVQQPQVTWIVRQYCKEDLQTISKVCSHFGVSSPDQLRMSHFRALVGQLQAAQHNGHQ
jgi:hypothetical protein